MMLSDLQKSILEKKGFALEDTEKLEKYLNPDWSRDLGDPSQIKDIQKSIARLKEAIDKKQKIFIYADYDCDGIPGAVILHDFFKKINYENFSVYLPHRHREGFGLNEGAIKKIKREGGELIITVDLGIANLEEIKLVRELGMEIIVTDHHLPLTDESGKQILPEAFAIINTKQTGDTYDEKYLCGASTAWKLVHEFLNTYRESFGVVEGYEKWLLDMVAIASVADLIPLENENRLLAKYGLRVLQKSSRPGLQKILRNAKINQKTITENDISFGIAPRINSASRMSDPEIAFRALLNNSEAVAYAEKLEQLNQQRKIETGKANDSLDLEKLKNQKIILLGEESWTPGILGLIASKIVEETGKTCFVWGCGEEKNVYKGSVRAGIEDWNVMEIMSECDRANKNILENFGGHAGAGGFSLKKANLKELEKFLQDYAEKNSKKSESENLNLQSSENILENDIAEKFLSLDLKNLQKNILRESEIFAPFGVANEKPIFRVGVDKVDCKRFGKNKEHLEMNLAGVRAIEFFVSETREVDLKTKTEFLVTIERDNFRGGIVLRLVK